MEGAGVGNRWASLDEGPGALHSPERQEASACERNGRVLRQPLTRAQYLLELRGVDPAFENNTAMAPEFLMEQMEWREALGEAREAADASALDDMARRIRERSRALVVQIGDEIDTLGDLPAAADTVRRLKFLERLQDEINDALASLDS